MGRMSPCAFMTERSRAGSPWTSGIRIVKSSRSSAALWKIRCGVFWSAGLTGGGSVPAPAFAAGGASEIVKFAQAESGKWTITAFAEMSNESRGTDVTDGQIKVFSADTLEALKSVTTPAAGATVKETKSAVKATVEVPAPSGKTSQFFKVKFGE